LGHGQVGGWPGDAEALETYLARAVRFYDLGQARDVEIARRTLERMEAEGQQIAVLIAGGFHTDHLIDLLSEQPVHIAVVTPLAGQEQDEMRYAQILKTKYQLSQQKQRQLPARLMRPQGTAADSTLEQAAKDLLAEEAWEELDEAGRQAALREAAQHARVKLAWHDPQARTLQEATQRLLALSQRIHTFTETLTADEMDVLRLDPAWFTGGISYGTASPAVPSQPAGLSTLRLTPSTLREPESSTER
jgi:hypothetical protein